MAPHWLVNEIQTPWPSNLGLAFGTSYYIQPDLQLFASTPSKLQFLSVPQTRSVPFSAPISPSPGMPFPALTHLYSQSRLTRHLCPLWSPHTTSDLSQSLRLKLFSIFYGVREPYPCCWTTCSSLANHTASNPESFPKVRLNEAWWINNWLA